VAQGLYLSQKMSLQQVLAPQLQQSLALLQAPTLELKALVEQELEQNPVLEEIPIEDMEQREKTDERNGDDGPPETPDPAEPPADVAFDPATERNNESPEPEPVDDFQAEFERLTQLDQMARSFCPNKSPHQAIRRGRGEAAVHVRFSRGGHFASGEPA